MPENNKYLEDIKELQIELNEVLEALLLTAGIHEDFIDEAVDAYIDCIDDIEGKNTNASLNAVQYLVKSYPQFCNPREILKESRKHKYKSSDTQEK